MFLLKHLFFNFGKLMQFCGFTPYDWYLFIRTSADPTVTSVRLI